MNLNKTPIVGAHWAADCVILGSIEYNYTFFQIKFIAAPNWWTGIYICNIYEVYSSTDPIKSAQYVSRAEYSMVAKEKKTLQRCYTHSSGDFNVKNIHQQGT